MLDAFFTANNVLCPGVKILDAGCGARIDSLIAARMVAPGGSVVGVDMTPEMLGKARSAAQTAGAQSVEVRAGYAEALPVEDGWADVVISNGVLNLAPDKPAALREMARVLKPGRRRQIGDILVHKAFSDGAKARVDLWTG